MSIFSSLRYPTAILFGLLLTASLFWSLWSFTSVRFESSPIYAVPISWGRTILDTPAEQKIREQQEIKQPPVMEPIEISGVAEGEVILSPIDVFVAVAAPPIPGAFAIGADSDVVPIVRITPVYPRRAAQNGIEGWVQVQFTVTGSGSVTDVMVVDSSPPNVFDDAAVEAVSRWRYSPKVEAAIAVDRVGVQTLLRFDLEEE